MILMKRKEIHKRGILGNMLERLHLDSSSEFLNALYESGVREVLEEMTEFPTETYEMVVHEFLDKLKEYDE